MYNRSRKSLIDFFIILVVLGVGYWLLSFGSDVRAQDEPTATPNAEGVIYVIVRPNDYLLGIAGRAGITLSELINLNGINENTIIQPGQKLIIGVVTPSPTATTDPPTPTSTTTRSPPTITATPMPPPRTAVCVRAYTDINQDGIYDSGEPLRKAIAFTIFNREAVVGNYVTDGASEPFCLEGLQPGDYEITRSIGRDETLTTDGHWSLTLESGQVMNLEFGSYTSGDMATETSQSVPPAATTELVAGSSSIQQISEENGRRTDLRMIGLTVLLVLFAAGGLSLLLRMRKSQFNK